jgi:glutamate-1-semialdehyde 2,1-aminomutase
MLEAGLQEAVEQARAPACVTRLGSVLTLFFTPGPVTDWESAACSDRQRFAVFFHRMLEQGVYLPPSQFEAWFVSLAHTEDDIRRTIEAVRTALRG